MPVSQASREAYARVLASGLISRCKLEVYEFVMNYQDDPNYGGSISRRDVAEYFGIRDIGDTFSKRLGELVVIGACRVVGRKSQLGGMVDGIRTTAATNLRSPPPPPPYKFYVQCRVGDLLLGPFKDVSVQRSRAIALAHRLNRSDVVMLLAVRKSDGRVVRRSTLRRSR